LAPNLTERRVVEVLGQLGSRESADVEVFNADDSVSIDKRGGELVQVIDPPISGLRVDSRKPPPLSRPIAAVRSLASELSMCTTQTAFATTVRARVLDHLAAAQRG
jgi:hypothetical protein